MKNKFKIGDKVVLKPDLKGATLECYRRWNIVLGKVYTVQYLDSSEDCRLNNGYWVYTRDIEISYSEMLKRVLE